MSARTASEEPADQGAPADCCQTGKLQSILTGDLCGRQQTNPENTKIMNCLVVFITFMVHYYVTTICTEKQLAYSFLLDVQAISSYSEDNEKDVCLGVHFFV